MVLLLSLRHSRYLQPPRRRLAHRARRKCHSIQSTLPGALLRNSRLRDDCPFPRQHQAMRTISAVPRAEKRFISAMRIWISAVWVSCSDAFTESLEAPHLRLDPASDMVSCPAFPERPAIVPGCAQGFVSGDCCRAVLFPGPTVLPDRNDRHTFSSDRRPAANPPPSPTP